MRDQGASLDTKHLCQQSLRLAARQTALLQEGPRAGERLTGTVRIKGWIAYCRRRRAWRSHLTRSGGCFGQGGELLGLMLRHQRGNQFVEVAIHNGVDLVQGQIDAVIGDSPLGEIVGADALGAVA